MLRLNEIRLIKLSLHEKQGYYSRYVPQVLTSDSISLYPTILINLKWRYFNYCLSRRFFSVWPEAWEWNLASKGTLITGVLAIYSCRYCCCSFAAREGTHLADVTGTSLLRWLLPKQLHLSSAVHTLAIGTGLISFLRCQNREQNGEKVDIAGGPKSKFRVITSTMLSWTKNDRKRHYYLFTWETFTKH